MTVKIGAVPAWPELPPALLQMLAVIEEEAEEEPPSPRPWELGGLPSEVVEPSWAWLDQVVSWLNFCFGWQAEAVIPSCWQQHPDLALEVAVLAYARVFAVQMTRPRDLRYWHDDLHAFYARMTRSLGDTGLKDCQRNKHPNDRPGAYELEAYERGR